MVTLADGNSGTVVPVQSSAAQQWLQRWQADHAGSIKYRAPIYGAAALPPSRIPRLITVTVGSAQLALDGHWGDNFKTFWTLSPEYAFHIFEDVDCESFLAACCPPDELTAFKLVKTGTQKSNVFLSIWLREIGGILVDQDTSLVKPLSSTIPPSASIATTWEYCFRSRAGCWMYGNLFAVEPQTPVWHLAAQRVVRNVLVQSHFACKKSARGCRGFFGCVQELTAQGPYARALSDFLKQHRCEAPIYPCQESSTGYCVRTGKDICQQATHSSLRNLVVLSESESPTRHIPCHAKPRTKATKKNIACVRPNETEVHYVSKAEGAYTYFFKTAQGKIDGSSAPGYFKPKCSDDEDKLLATWTQCLEVRSQSPARQSRYNTLKQKDLLQRACSTELAGADAVEKSSRRRHSRVSSKAEATSSTAPSVSVTSVTGAASAVETIQARKVALVTGITGQDGSYLAELLLSKGYDVHGMVRRSSSLNTHRIKQLIATSGRLHLHYGDLADTVSCLQIMTRVQPTEVYNLAAQSHVRTSFDTAQYTGDVDGLGVLRLLDAIRSAGLQKRVRFYQASTSELYGRVREVPQSETTPFYPRSPYGVAKMYGYWILVNYREAYGIHASNGILFNHESPRRGPTFVTRKVTRAVARIYLGLQDVLFLGNLDATRDWGHARDYVRAMWLILQKPEPSDYVIATGKTVSVRSFVEWSFKAVGIKLLWRGEGVSEVGYAMNQSSMVPRVRIDPKYYRPTEVAKLLGDPSKAKRVLGWEPATSVEELCREMVEADLNLVRAGDLES